MKVQHIDGLFHLHLISARLSGYYINAQGHVYSTRRGGIDRLYGNAKTGQFKLNYINYTADWLLRAAKHHKLFEAETRVGAQALTTARVCKVTQLGDSVHAADVAHGVEKQGWVIASIADGALAFGLKPKIHLTEASVRAEMTRLATAHPGVKFVSLKIEKTLVSQGLVWG